MDSRFGKKLRKKFLMGELYFYPKPGDIVMDIGACTGDMTYYYSLRVGEKGRVYSIEPSNINYKTIRNKFRDTHNIRAFNIAFSDSCRKGMLYLSQDSSHHSLDKEFDWNTKHNANVGEEEVDIKTLDSFIEGQKIERLDCIYMNVEGSELNILKGFETFIDKLSPVIYIHAHSDSLIETCKEFLIKHNYTVLGFKNNNLYAVKGNVEFLEDKSKKSLKCLFCNNKINELESIKLDELCFDCYYDLITKWTTKL
jgi:FkbM family methyltransferase